MLPWHSSGSWVFWALATLDSLAGACNKFCTCLHHNPVSSDCHYWCRCQAITHIWFGNTKFPHPRKVKKICSPRNSSEDVCSSFGSSPQKTRNNPIPLNGWTDKTVVCSCDATVLSCKEEWAVTTQSHRWRLKVLCFAPCLLWLWLGDCILLSKCTCTNYKFNCI